jgi:hypothetical protein
MRDEGKRIAKEPSPPLNKEALVKVGIGTTTPQAFHTGGTAGRANGQELPSWDTYKEAKAPTGAVTYTGADLSLSK